MPERGDRWSAAAQAGASGVLTAGPSDEPVWAPQVRHPVSVVVPAEHVGSGQPVQELPCLGVYGPDLVFEEYVYLEGRRVQSASGVIDLDLDLDPRPVALSTGGTIRNTYLVMRVIGQERDTYAGPAHDVVPCFLLVLDADADGRPDRPHTAAIAWLVHHPDQRVGKVEADFERLAGQPDLGWDAAPAPAAQPAAAAAAAPVPAAAPSVPASPPLASPAPAYAEPAHAATAAAGPALPPPPVGVPVSTDPPGETAAEVPSVAVTVLPKHAAPERKRGFLSFGRRG